MRVLLTTLAATAIGCAAPLPPAASPDLLVVQVSTVPVLASSVAPAANASEPAAPVGTNLDAMPIVGAWSWNDDIATYQTDGTGTYERAGALCFAFTYTVSGDVLTTIADRDHTCGAHRTTSYRIEVQDDALTMTHIGSEYVSNWKRR